MKKLSFLCYMFLVFLGINACTDDTDGTPGIAPGSMQVSGIFPDSASGGNLVTIKGKGLGDIRTIFLEKGNIPVGFQPTLNTDEVIMFRVPLDALGGVQDVILTNGNGVQQKVSLRVLAFPVVYTTSNYNFTEGTQITITGNNLDDVTKVSLTESGEEVKVVSKSKTEMVIEFPKSSINRSTLDIVNTTGLLRTTDEYVNLDNAYHIFTDEYGEGFQDGSWGDGAVITEAEAKSGSKSIYKNFQKGNWHLINFANWWPGVTNDNYQYLTVWIKGASKDYTLYLTSDQRAGGFGNGDRSYPLNIPANTWTYFKIPISEVKLWENGDPFFQLGFWIPGPDAQDEIFHFDDVILVK